MLPQIFSSRDYISSSQRQGIDVLAGWKYIFLPKYRSQVHEKWQREDAATVIVQILGGVFSVGLTGLILGWFITMLAYSAWGVKLF